MSQNALTTRFCCPDPAEGAYSVSPNLLAGFRGPLHDGEGKKKKNVKELGREKGRRGDEKVGEGVEGVEG